MLEQDHIQPPPPPERVTLDDLERLAVGNNAAGVTSPAPKTKKTKPKMPRKDNRFRCQFRFWLDANKPDEYAIGQELAALKTKREYLPTVRNAIRLFLSLLKGETALLKEMFPLIVDQIELEMIVKESEDDKNDISGQLEDIRKTQAEMQRQLAEQNSKIIPLFDNGGKLIMSGDKPSVLSANNTLGKNVSFSLPLVDDDDDGDTMVIKESANKPTAFQNLMASFGKADDRSEQLYAERLARGDIDPRTGRSLSARLD